MPVPFDIHISTGSSVPIYRQIVEQVCHAAATGTVAPDEQLPSVRDLAERLVINPNTVARAYGDLVREGVAESRQGKGVFVAHRRQALPDAERRRRLGTALDAVVREALFLDFTPDEVREALEQRLRDFPRRSNAAGQGRDETTGTRGRGKGGGHE